MENKVKLIVTVVCSKYVLGYFSYRIEAQCSQFFASDFQPTLIAEQDSYGITNDDRLGFPKLGSKEFCNSHYYQLPQGR